MKKFLLAFLVLLGTSLPILAGQVTFDFKNEEYGMTRLSGNTQQYNPNPLTIENGEVKAVLSGGKNRLWGDGMRFYTSSMITLYAPEGNNIVNVQFTSGSPSSFKFEPDSEDTSSSSIWTGRAEAVTIAYTPTKDYKIITAITVTYEPLPDPSKQPAGLSYSEASYAYRMGSSWNGPVLDNPNSLDVEYTSSEESVATVAADGSVTPLAPGTTVIKAIFPGNDEFQYGEAYYNLTISDAAHSIAEMLEKAPNKNDVIYVDFPMTVTYVSGSNVYVTDGKDFTLLYGPNSYEDLDIVPAGWEAKSSPFNGLPEFAPVSTFPAAEGKGSFVPRTVSLSEVDKSCLNEVMIITDVLFKEATPSALKKDFTGYDGSAELRFRTNFNGVPSVEAGKYDVKAVPSIYVTNTSEQLQTFPISYEAIPKMVPNLSFPQAAYTATIGQEFESPAVVNPDGLALSYSSSNEAVATVDASGKVTLVAAGEAVISAIFAGDYDYVDKTVTYLLTVTPRIKIDVTLTWSAGEAEATVGKDFTAPTLSVTPEEARSAVAYSSSDTSVATIDAEGNVELVGEGTSTITAAISDNEYYKDATISYNLSVKPAIVQIKTSMSFAAATAEATLHHSFTAPVLTVEPKAAEALVKYSSSDEEVAQVANDGSVTLIAAGTTTITATITETENFSGATASYDLTVSDEPTTLSWSRNEFTAILGDDFEAPVLTVAPEAAKALVAYSSSDEAVATISAEGELTLVAVGETTITAAIEPGEGYKDSTASYKLTVEARPAPTTAEVTFDFLNETYGMERMSGSVNTYNPNGLVIENGEVQGKLTGGNTRLWSDGLRFYKNSKIILSAPEEGNIVKVVYTSPAAGSFEFSPESEDATEARTWTGSSREVEIDCKVTEKNAAIGTITVTYDLVSDPNKGKAQLSFPEKTYTAVMGQEFESPVLQNPHSLAVTYESTNPEVATIDAEGNVTLVESGITTITATFAGNDDYNPGSASYDLTVMASAGSIAEMIKEGESDATARIVVTTPLTVTYVNAQNVYVTDGKDFTLLYGSNSYEALDIIPAGWTATYSPYGGMAEFKPAGAFPAADGKGEFTPREVSLISVDEAMVNEIVVIKNVVFEEATPEDKSNFTGSDGEENLAFRNNFAVASVEAGAYDVLAAVATYNGVLQVYPIEYTAIEKVTPVITFAEEELTAGLATFITIAQPTVEPADVAINYYIEELPATAYDIQEDGDNLTVIVRRAGKFTLVAKAEATAITEAAEARMTLIITPRVPQIFVDGESITSTEILIPAFESVKLTATTVSGTDILYAIVEEDAEPEYKALPEAGIEISETCKVWIVADCDGVQSEVTKLSFTVENGVALVYGDNIRVEGNDIIAPEGARVYDMAGRAVGFRGLPAGIYVVNYGNNAIKVVVK